MSPTPGILYVTVAPSESLSPAQFHDWYNNEHGPGRMKLPQIFHNGFRYRASDNLPNSPESPKWMAIYDVSDMAYMTRDVYMRLRKDPVQSQRERDTMKQIKVNRKFYDLRFERHAADFPRFEEVQYEGTEQNRNVMVAMLFKVKEPELGKELERWYDEEHIGMLTKVPGWRRSRRFVTSYVEPPSDPLDTEYLALHEYAPNNGLYTSNEFKAANDTKWRHEIMKNVVQGGPARRVYELYYTFGAASRDLASLSDPSIKEFISNDGLTWTIPASAPKAAVESFITTDDGVKLPYRLEGSTHPNAPLIILINSVLVNYSIWDSFISAFYLRQQNRKYRIVRYNSRGRSMLPSTSKQPVTVDDLASDVISILDALRVPKAALVVGVSLGGATALNAAIKHPSRVAKFIACDTNAMAPPSNPKAWDDRVAITEKEGAILSSALISERLGAQAGERTVGQNLAEATVRRWFTEKSYASQDRTGDIARVRDMVATNSLAGFKTGVKALYQYDFRDDMKAANVPGLFVVGAADGVLPKTMADMAAMYGDGSARLEVVPDAGHLPMVEQPEIVADIISSFALS